MGNKDSFLSYIKSEYDCDSVYSYVVKVMDNLKSGEIDSLSSVIIYIADNYDDDVFEEFINCYEDFLNGNSRAVRKYDSVLQDVDFKYVKVRKLY